MPSTSPSIPHIVERVERLLARYEELRAANARLADEVQRLTRERDDLSARMAAVRVHVDALLARLPPEVTGAPEIAVAESTPAKD